MLTQLKVSGFKSLDGADIRFGAFTCVAGANGVGKSNLFDAIGFLRALADLDLVIATLSGREFEGAHGYCTVFSALDNTWRIQDRWATDVQPAMPIVARGLLTAFLNPIRHDDPRREPRDRIVKVKQRDDLQMLLPLK